MYDFLIAGYDCSVLATRRSHSAQNHPSILEPDQIGLTVKPRIVCGRPRNRNEFLSVTNIASLFSRSFAYAACHLSRAATNFTLTDDHRFAVLIPDDIAEMILVHKRPAPSSIAIGKKLPEVVGIEAGDIPVRPVALRQFQTRTRTIHLAVFAAGRATSN